MTPSRPGPHGEHRPSRAGGRSLYSRPMYPLLCSTYSLLCWTAAAGVTVASGSPRPLAPADSLAARIRARVAAVPGAVVGVAYRHLTRPDSLYLDADSSFHAASTMKVPVMVELFRRADAGALSLDQEILLVNQF